MLKIIRKFETKIQVGNGFWLDFTLKTPIKTKNRFLELNSIANFYSENPETQKKDRYPQNNLPSINLIGSQFQLYVSEYSINTAIFTFLTEKSKPLSFRVGTKILNSMLPGIVDKYGEKQATVTLIQSPNSNVKITDQYFGINVPGTLSIKVDGITNEILNCNLDLSLKVDIIVNYQNMQNYVTGNIKELSAKVKEVKVNEVSKSDISFIESGFKFIDITVIKLLNEFIKNNFLFSVPPIMGVTLINIKFIHKNGYFEVNYDIMRKCSFDPKSFFDANFYREKYIDMRTNRNNDELFKHYIQHGIYEGRSPSEIFDPGYYLEANSDLKKAFGNNFKSAYDHFINTGCYERRDLSPVFNLNYYKEKNPDVVNAFDDDENAIISHFINNGMKEGRIASTKFDINKYKSNYSDLRNAFKNNNRGYYTHYCIAGIKEGRQAK